MLGRVLTYLVLVFLQLPMSGQDWKCPWQYRQEIDITENTNSTLNNYQVKITVPFATGMNNDFSDLRFTTDDGLTDLDYWVEYKEDGVTATVWVELDQLSANATEDFYMYYGNPSATSLSDGDATWLFFDDMTSLAGWNSIGSNSISVGTVNGASVLVKQNNCDPQGGYKDIGTTISTFRLVTREIRTTTGGGCGLNRYGLESSNFRGYTLNRNAATNGNGNFGYERRVAGNPNQGTSTNLPQPANNWYRTEFSKCDDNSISAVLREDNLDLIGSRSGSNPSFSSFSRVTVRGGREYYIDYMAVGEKACTEPTVALNAVTKCVEATITTTVDDNCQDGTGSVTINIAEGAAPYEIEWESTDATVTGSTTTNSAGNLTIPNLIGNKTYNITVTDDNGCTP